MVFKFDEAEFHWKWKWFFRPRQGTGMTVEVYYTQFRDWKEEMINLSLPAAEEDYIDGFVENLRWDIRLRSSKYRSSWNRLIDAFYAAKFDETMILIEENLTDIREERAFDEMPSRFPIDSQRVSVVPGNDSVHIIDTLGMVGDISHQESVLENPVCNLFYEMAETIPIARAAENSVVELMEKEACKVFAEMSESTLEEDLLVLEGTKVAHHMFDEMPNLSSVDSYEEIYGNGDSLSSFSHNILDPIYDLLDKMPIEYFGEQNEGIGVHDDLGCQIDATKTGNVIDEMLDAVSAIEMEEQILEHCNLIFSDNKRILFDPGGLRMSKFDQLNELKELDISQDSDSGLLELARLNFDVMPNTNVFSGDSMISSCVQQGMVYVVRKIFEPISSNLNKRMTRHLISQVEGQENESTRRRDFGNNICDIQHHMPEQLVVAGTNRITHIELAQEFVLMTGMFYLHRNASFSDCQWTLAKVEQKKSACLNLLKELIDYGYTVCGNIIEGNDVFERGNDVYRYELRSVHEFKRTICPTRCTILVSLVQCGVDPSVNHMDKVMYKVLSVSQAVKTLIDELMHLQLRFETSCCIECPNCLEHFFTGNTKFGELRSVNWACSWQVVYLIKNYQRMASDGSLNGEHDQLLLIELGNLGGMKLKIMVDMLKIVLPLATILETTVMEIREGFMSSIWFGEGVGPNIDSKFPRYYANVLAYIQTRLRSGPAQGIRFRFGWQTMSYKAMRVVAAIILSIISHQVDLHRNKELGLELYIVEGQVGLESVVFSYPLRHYIHALKNATLMVLTGMRTTLVRSIGSGKSTVVTELENFIWDPGQCAIFVYIVEEKDVLKRKGIRVRLSLKQDEGLIGASTYYNAHLEFLACSLIDRDLLLLFIILPLFVTFGSSFRTNSDYICTRIGSWGIDFEEASNNLIKAPVHGGDMRIISINGLQRNGYVQTTLFAVGTDMENFVWNPGTVCFRLTTLRARWLLRGRICHESGLKLKKKIIFLFTVETVSKGDVIRLPFYVSNVVVSLFGLITIVV